jgi:lysophospholipase L1-like esterase
MNIICLGDSLTFGYGVWRSDCWVTLVANATGLRVLNRGTNGDTSAYMYQRAKRRIVPYETEPGDIAIIMGGANDTLMYGADENDVKNILNIAELFSAKNCTPIIGIQPGFKPSHEPFYGPMDLNKLNDNFDWFADKLITSAKDSDLKYFDLRPILENPALFSDGVHPTEEGHRIIADTVLKLVHPLINA